MLIKILEKKDKSVYTMTLKGFIEDNSQPESSNEMTYEYNFAKAAVQFNVLVVEMLVKKNLISFDDIKSLITKLGGDDIELLSIKV